MTAVELLPAWDANPQNERWHQLRREGVSASEIAVVLGISPFESPFSLYWRKIHGWDVEATDEMRAGQILEPAIADWFEQYGDPLENLVFRKAGLYASSDRPWQLATPDRLVYLACPGCDGDGAFDGPFGRQSCHDCHRSGVVGPPAALVECKYVVYSWDGWGEEGTDEIPVYYRAQTQQQMDVLDVDQVYVPVLGPGGFRAYTVRRDERDIAVLREAGQRFMYRLATRDAPDLDDHETTLAAVKRLNAGPLDDTEPVKVPAAIAAGYRRAIAMTRLAAVVKRRYEARLIDAMGQAKRAVDDAGARVATRVISEVGERTQTVKAHTRDYLLPPREKKTDAS